MHVITVTRGGTDISIVVIIIIIVVVVATTTAAVSDIVACSRTGVSPRSMDSGTSTNSAHGTK
jgi:hypothetical protein